MKVVISALAFSVAGFIIWCQDSTLTDPSGTMPSIDRRLSRNVPGNIIEPLHTLFLNQVLHEPGNNYNSFVQTSGTVAYQATVVPLDPIPPNPQYAVRLNLTATAEARPYQLNEPVWHVAGTSDDVVPIPESGSAFLTKRYQLEGRNDGMLLNVRIRITLASVELSSMWLELPPTGHGADGD